MTIEIPPGEQGRIRIFAINAAPDEIGARLAQEPKADLARDLLAAPHLDTRSVEIFPIRDLEGLGLAQYLIDGYAVPEDTLTDDRQKLDALDGYVLLLFSDSFDSTGGQLAPGAQLTLIGTYAETLPDNRQRPTITASAAPYSGTLVTEPVAAPRGGAGRALMIIALVTTVGILLWWLL